MWDWLYCVLNEAMLLAYRPYSCPTFFTYFRDMTAILAAIIVLAAMDK